MKRRKSQRVCSCRAGIAGIPLTGEDIIHPKATFLRSCRSLQHTHTFVKATANHMRLCFLLIAAVMASPPLLWAQWQEFIPTPYENGADLDIYSSYESDESKTDGHRLFWKDTFLKEKITAYSNGYVYHPRFMQYHLSLGGALKQEDFTASYTDVGWNNTSGLEYDVELVLLPEHPYHLKLFTRRIEPLFREQSATLSHNVESSRGAIFQYRKKPYFFGMSYIEDSLESSTFESDVDTFNINGRYLNRFKNIDQFSLGMFYKHSSFSSSTGITGDSDEYMLDNVIDLKKVSLSSSLSKNTFTQDSSFSGSFENSQLSWYERLNAKLPLNFRTELSYNYRENELTSAATSSLLERNISDTTKRLELNIAHRLYQSLDTTYLYRRDWTASDTNNTDSSSQTLITSYTKTIPWGMLLAGLNLGKMVTDSSGQKTSVNESHPAVSVPGGSFVLFGQGIDPSTIVVYLRSPLPPFEIVRLVENTHYIVTPFGNSFQITLLDLPSPPFAVPGTYDFFASYDSVAGQFELETKVYGYNISLNLFGNLVNPYYTYTATESEVLSGTFVGVPVDSRLTTLGVILQQLPWRAQAEYQDFNSNISPYTLWRTTITYTGNINETTRGYATVAYSHKRYPEGTSIEGGPGYTEKITSLSGNVQKQFPEKHLVFSLGGTFSSSESLTDTTTYSANSSLAWTVGQLVVSMGATAYRSESETTSIITERVHQFYYLNIKRQLL